MGVATSLQAIDVTAAAQASAQAQGADMRILRDHAIRQAFELSALVKQIVAFHPKGDKNMAALKNMVEVLA